MKPIGILDRPTTQSNKSLHWPAGFSHASCGCNKACLTLICQ